VVSDGVLVSVLLASARIWACLRVQASWRVAVGASWEWIAGALAVAIATLAWAGGRLDASGTNDGHAFVVALLLELLLGSVLGLAISLPGWALVGAAQESEQALAWQGESGSFARLFVVASLAAGFALGLHAPLCAGLLGLFDRFALAHPSAWLPAVAELPSQLIDHCVAITLLGLALATPVLLTRMIVSLCLASLGRARLDTQDWQDVLAPGLRLGAGLVALGAAWSAYPEAFARGM
jgi:flagellar biosynthesis protein FliR